MGANLLAILAALALQTPQDTTVTYATPATRDLVLRAAERHRAQDSAVTDYRARLRYRLTVSLGRRRWGRYPVSAAEEQDVAVAWQLPNDLRVDVIGRRFTSRTPATQLSSVFDRPWFVPRGVGDSVRIFSNDFPATGALHPLGAGAEAAYHYDLTDSVTVSTPDARRIRLYAVQVTPKRVGPALIAGRVWLDSATAEVVRLTFRYVGTALWARPDDDETRDAVSAERINKLVNRVLSIDVDLEYGLQEGRYWMPYRQAIAGTIRIPVVSDVVIPFRAVTTFEDYEINTGRPVAFDLPLPDSTMSPEARRAQAELRRDSLRDAREGRPAEGDTAGRGWQYADRWAGGRFEVHRPPNDTLALYQGWTDSLELENSEEDDRRIREAQADLAGLVEELPGELSGRTARGFAFQTLADAFQYNRVQGVSLGAGYRLRLPGRFADLYGTLRFGFSDERLTGRLAAVRDAPGGRVTFAVYRDLTDADPVSAGRTLANSMNALFAAHDYADYFLATGAALQFERSLRTGLEVTAVARAERHRSVVGEAKSGVNDFLGGRGLFPENPPVAEGDYGTGSLRLNGFGRLRWTLGVDGLAGGGITSARAFVDARRSFGGAQGLTLRVKGGVADASAPPQMQYRLGGMHTVRGFEYGAARGPAFWSAQLDASPLSGTIRPVVFVDAGQAGTLDDIVGSRALVGGGVGVSVYSPLLRTTLVRLDVSHSLTPDTGSKWRFDLVFQPVR
jgi:hypothetical protein